MEPEPGPPAQPVVVVFTGLPGTGKSTMADRTAMHLGAPAFSGDWLMGSLKPAAAQLAQLGREAYSRLYHSVLGGLLTRQLLLGQSAVLDCLVTDDVADHWRSTAIAHGAALKVVECVCSDVDLHRSRVEGRVRGIPGWHEIDWSHVERMRGEFPTLTGERLTLDAVGSPDSNFRSVCAYVLGAVGSSP
ncbi:hypothetical protein EXU48_14160 [Occultella glacieicola]|uniref:Kinase n=1 Tax=Occultella glacieicola TaxID=2518684 RepID=A0ABY2E727_9MICO|nr:AAA family ATPase [Occultella glacieicola]TDE92672.1 hypothetical protein EXU48_14160 [Occultella glacieicola]